MACVNARHGRGAAWARHVMFESAFNGPCIKIRWLKVHFLLRYFQFIFRYPSFTLYWVS